VPQQDLAQAIRAPSDRQQTAVAFGPFRFVPRARQLTRDGATVKLGGRALDLLTVLVENEGEVVGHRELMARVWPGVFVEEVSLRVHIAALRKALDMGKDGPCYLINVPGRGYSLVKTQPLAEDTLPVAPLYALPAAPSNMVGRDDEIQLLCDAVGTEKLITIVGAGGVGKTTVALAAGHTLLPNFGGVVCFVDLSRVAEPNMLAGAVAAAAGIPVNALSPVASLIARFAARRTLLILDNCEHLVAEVSSLAEQLLAGAPELCILATSREALNVRDELVHRLDSLRCPPDDARLSAAELLAFPAVALFVDRLVASGAEIPLDDVHAAIIGGICRKLGGIALAIELAAGRVGALGLRETASRLDNQFSLRWPGRRTAPPRHQTMSATLEWSYNLLSDNERRALRRLAVFTGDFSFDDAAGVVAGDTLTADAVHDAILGLWAKSLTAGPAVAGGRHRLLETTRAYAAQKLGEAGEENDFRRKHAEHFNARLFALEAARSNPVPGVQPPNVDIDNVRGALRWAFGPHGDPQLGAYLSALSAPLWIEKGLFVECAAWMSRARSVLAATGLENSEAELVIQIAAAAATRFSTGFSAHVHEEFVRVLELATRLNDVRWQLFSTLGLWTFVFGEQALERARQCAEIARRSDDSGATAMANWMMGTSEHRLGRLEEGRKHLEFALANDNEKSRRVQLSLTGYDRRIDAMCEYTNLLWLQGFADQAASWRVRAVNEACALGLALPLSTSMTWAAFNRYLTGNDIDDIEQQIVEALEHTRAQDSPGYQGVSLFTLGLCQARRADFDAARPLVMKALELMTEGNHREFHAIARAHLCEAAIDAGRIADARAIMSAIGDEEREYWSKPEVARVRGRMALARGDDAAAQRHFLEAMAIAQTQGALSWELRAVMDLANLRAARGAKQEARESLAKVYDRFTEGFETIDLLRARRLMKEL
jgi:predicted ATPase/DNA-binding winged helix-turn-helix (wHTH) protein